MTTQLVQDQKIAKRLRHKKDKEFILYSLFCSTYQEDVSQFQMVISGYIYNYEHDITQRLISAMEHLIRA